MTETLCETLLAVSVPVTVMVTVPDGVEAVVATVKMEVPVPPVIVGLSSVAITFELAAAVLSETVPVKPLFPVTLIV